MLEKNYIIPLLGVFSFTSASAAWIFPCIAITSHKVNLQKGARGIHPQGCLPL